MNTTNTNEQGKPLTQDEMDFFLPIIQQAFAEKQQADAANNSPRKTKSRTTIDEFIELKYWDAAATLSKTRNLPSIQNVETRELIEEFYDNEEHSEISKVFALPHTYMTSYERIDAFMAAASEIYTTYSETEQFTITMATGYHPEMKSHKSPDINFAALLRTTLNPDRLEACEREKKVVRAQFTQEQAGEPVTASMIDFHPEMLLTDYVKDYMVNGYKAKTREFILTWGNYGETTLGEIDYKALLALDLYFQARAKHFETKTKKSSKALLEAKDARNAAFELCGIYH